MRALITGAASGIGKAVALRLAEDATARGEEATLALLDYAEGPLRELAAELGGRPGLTAAPVIVDLSKPEAITRAVAESISFTGGLDALISNAGVVGAAPLTELTLETYERDFAVNTRATFLLAQACYPKLKESRGCIVATASLSASEATANLGAYSASKASVVMLIKQLAREWGPDGIRANCVSPGAIVTGMTAKTYEDSDVEAARSAQVPLRRVGKPADIAAAIAFLTGRDAAYITGVNLPVDGGWGIALMPEAAAARRPA